MSTTEKLFSNIPNSNTRGGYCYRKTAHPRTSDEPQGYEDTEIADTLNIFDYTEARTPILVVEVKNERSDICMTISGAASDTHHIPCVMIANSSGGGISATLDSNYFKGCGERQGIEREVVFIRRKNE